MIIKIIEDETGDILTSANVHVMRLPFQYGWSAWGVFDELDRLVERFTSFRAAVASLSSSTLSHETRRLTLTRKADRRRMIAILEQTAREAGATIAEIEEDTRSNRITIEAARGLQCTVDIDGDDKRLHGGEIFCTPWHFSTEPMHRENTMGKRFPGEVNPHHRRKSTCFQQGFGALHAHWYVVLYGAREGWIFLDGLTPEELAAAA